MIVNTHRVDECGLQRDAERKCGFLRSLNYPEQHDRMYDDMMYCFAPLL